MYRLSEQVFSCVIRQRLLCCNNNKNYIENQSIIIFFKIRYLQEKYIWQLRNFAIKSSLNNQFQQQYVSI